jgi:Na+/H+ antiporter NhaD/arsenite permease-like protein
MLAIDHEVLAAMIGGFAIMGAALTTGLFSYLAVKMRNGKHDIDERLDLIESDLESLKEELPDGR